MFVHELPTTGAISFADFVLATRYSTEVARTTEYRAQLRSALKDNRKNAKDEHELAQGDWLKIVQVGDCCHVTWHSYCVPVGRSLAHRMASPFYLCSFPDRLWTITCRTCSRYSIVFKLTMCC